MKKAQSNKIEIESNINYRPTKDFRTNSGEKMAGFIRRFFDSTQIVVISLGLLVLIYLFVASFSIVDGPSMLPNFVSGDLTVYEKITTTTNKLQRGDVVVFQEINSGKDFIKRVIGLPGDRVKVEGGKVWVNGVPINEYYLSSDNKNVTGGSVFQEGLEIPVAQDKYVVFGDNRKVSLDSRNIGLIDKKYIKGKVVLVFWPINKFHTIDHINYPELGNN